MEEEADVDSRSVRGFREEIVESSGTETVTVLRDLDVYYRSLGVGDSVKGGGQAEGSEGSEHSESATSIQPMLEGPQDFSLRPRKVCALGGILWRRRWEFLDLLYKRIVVDGVIGAVSDACAGGIFDRSPKLR